MQQLRHDQVRDLVVHRSAEEDDPLVEQARVDVEGALAPRALLDDHWHEGHQRLLCNVAMAGQSTDAWRRLSPDPRPPPAAPPAPRPPPAPRAATRGDPAGSGGARPSPRG